MYRWLELTCIGRIALHDADAMVTGRLQRHQVAQEHLPAESVRRARIDAHKPHVGEDED